MVSPFCKCGNLRRPKQKNCRECHRAYARKNRRKHTELAEEAIIKANARSYANVYLRRGKLEREPCIDCGDMFTEMHHHDYSKPLDVEWICRPCHLKRHVL